MSDLSFQNRLQLYGSRLTKSELKIADFILAEPERAAVCPSQDMSREIGTSNSTLTRFCQKLEYRNYIEFQTLLTAEGAPRKVPGQVVERMVSYYHRTLEAAVELLQTEKIQVVVEHISKARKIVIFGLGSSGLTAKELNIRMVQMGLTSSAVTDSSLMMFQASLFSKQDLVIAISNSGETREVVEACKMAKQVGTPVCLLTRCNHSSLTELANHVLVAGDTGQIGDTRFVNVQMPMTFLVDILTYELLGIPTYRESRERTEQALANR